MKTDVPSVSESNTPYNKNLRIRAFLVVAGTFAGAAVMYFTNPAVSRFFPKCLMYLLTGIYCPGCGSGRASHELLHGHVVTAMGYNILFVLSMPLIAYYVAGNVLILLGKKPWPELKITHGAAWAMVVIIFAFMILRNIHIYPFTILAP